MHDCIMHSDKMDGHHSADMLRVFHGYQEPMTVCGFHGTYFMPEAIKRHNEQIGRAA